MPELPEAEANRRRVEAGALNRTITGFRVTDAAPMHMPSTAERKRFEGTRLTRTHRHGKYIFAGSASGPWLVVHLGMTGSLRVCDAGEEPDHTKLRVDLEGGRVLAFRCPRKFGWVKVTDDPETFVADAGLGPDAMQIGANAFADTIGATRTAIKTALIDQKRLAGIGNLWSDETLWRVGLMPDVPADTLDAKTVKALHDEFRAVLEAVLDTDADYSKLPDDWLIHRRKVGATCPRCGGTIAKTTVGGRTAYHCPDHQKGAA